MDSLHGLEIDSLELVFRYSASFGDVFHSWDREGLFAIKNEFKRGIFDFY